MRSPGEQPAPADRADDRQGFVRPLIWMLGIAIAAAVIGSAVVTALFPATRLTVVAPRAQAAMETASSITRLFAALVLSLFPTRMASVRLQWVAAGLVALGLGGIAFVFVPALFGAELPLRTAMYESIIVWSAGGALFCVGLFSRRAPECRRITLFAIGCIATACAAIALALPDRLPELASYTTATALAATDDRIVHGLTVWHHLLALIPFGLAVCAALGALRNVRITPVGAWLLVAMVVLADAELDNALVPSAYTTVMTNADLLRFVFGLLVAVGAVLELRRVAAERYALLHDEQERTERLHDLGVLRANFTSMVAHELHQPLAAIRAYLAMVRTGELAPDDTGAALSAMDREIKTLVSLADDVAAAAIIEREDFEINLRPIALSTLLNDVTIFIASLPGAHPVEMPPPSDLVVRADGNRVRQVLHNLLSNAAKYSPPGAPIALRVEPRAGWVRFAVSDQGQGIDPAEMERIFERFGRGRGAEGSAVSGMGLGLYLSRGIMRAHGSDLHVETQVGAGSTFWFDLERVV